MLVAIVDDKEKDFYAEIYLKIEKDKKLLSGYIIKNGTVSHLTKDVFEYFKTFILGKHCRKIFNKNGYDVYLDNETNLLHYYKDGKADYNMFFELNGREAILFSGLYSRYTGRKSFKVKAITFLLSSAFILEFMVGIMTIKGEFLISSDLSFDSLNVVTGEDIKNYIYSSQNIPQIVKDYLSNEDLINDVLPYYDRNRLIVLGNRNCNISVIDFTDEEKEKLKDINGYYNFDNILHVLDYDPNNFDTNSLIAFSTAHEYVHLLQSNECSPFVVESIVGLIVKEYFVKNYTDSNIIPILSYKEASKYLQILMEIIGSEPIWQDCFQGNSTAIEAAVRPFLSESEFKFFSHVMNLNPYYDREELEKSYDKFYEVLGILYYNKFNRNIENDKFIQAIYNNSEYRRIYFNKALMEEYPSYYLENLRIPYESAVKNGFLTFRKDTGINSSEYYDGIDSDNKYLQINFKTSAGKLASIKLQNGKLVQDVKLPNGTSLLSESCNFMGYFEVETLEAKDVNINCDSLLRIIFRENLESDKFIEIIVRDGDVIESVSLSDGTRLSESYYSDYFDIKYYLMESIDSEEFKNNYNNGKYKMHINGDGYLDFGSWELVYFHKVYATNNVDSFAMLQK